MEMQPIEPNRMLTASLTAEQWNIVLMQLNEAPYRIARPIIDSLMVQLQQQALPPMSSTEDLIGEQFFTSNPS